jgi:hypothetical protein
MGVIVSNIGRIGWFSLWDCLISQTIIPRLDLGETGRFFYVPDKVMLKIWHAP